jgi:hypothetical protein
MEFDAVKSEVKEVNLDKLRTDADNYFEAVVIKDEMQKLTQSLEKFFGSPAWPAPGSRLSLSMKQAVDRCGGIMPGQTLYFWSQGKDEVFAMVWPWQDGKHTTVKIAKK